MGVNWKHKYLAKSVKINAILENHQIIIGSNTNQVNVVNLLFEFDIFNGEFPFGRTKSWKKNTPNLS